MGKYVPGTGGIDSFGKTYVEVFAPNVAALLKWLWLIGLLFTILSWVGGTLDIFISSLFDWFLLCGAGQVGLWVYTTGIEAGIEYARTQMQQKNGRHE
jgi:hypothetical protein